MGLDGLQDPIFKGNKVPNPEKGYPGLIPASLMAGLQLLDLLGHHQQVQQFLLVMS